MLLALPLLRRASSAWGILRLQLSARNLYLVQQQDLFRRAAENQLHVIDERARDLFPAVSVRALPEGEGASHFDARLAYRG